MDASQAIDLARQAVMLTLMVAAPVLLVGLIVAAVVGVLQAATQVQEQTLSFVPKMAAMVVRGAARRAVDARRAWWSSPGRCSANCRESIAIRQSDAEMNADLPGQYSLGGHAGDGHRPLRRDLRGRAGVRARGRAGPLAPGDGRGDGPGRGEQPGRSGRFGCRRARLELAVALSLEAAIGAAIGYLARLVFVGVELAAAHVGQQMGLGLAEVFHPLHEDASQAVGRLLEMTVVVIFLAIGGHRLLLSAMLNTFHVLPAGFARLGGNGVWPSCQAALKAATAMLATSFALALKLAAPVLAAILMTTAAAGLVEKTLPQLNILTVGLPIRALLGLAVLAVSLAVLAPLIGEAVEAVTRQWAIGHPGGPGG